MKKQVLSFSEFINEAYSMMINEAKTWEDVKTLLADQIDKDTANILAYVEDCLASDEREGAKGVDILAVAGEAFSKVISERLGGKYTNITEVKTEIRDIEYNECIQGSFYVVKNSPIGSEIAVQGKSLGKFVEESGKMKIQDFLNMINLKNISKLSGAAGGTTSVNKKGAEFSNIDKSDKAEGDGLWGKLGFKKIGDGKKIKGSGSHDQYYITGNNPQIEFGKWENKAKVTPVSGAGPVDMSADVGNVRKLNLQGISRYKEVEQKSKKASMAEFTYVLYALDPKSVSSGRGKGVKKSFTDVKEVKIKVKEPDVTETLVMEDNGVIFGQNSAKLTEQGGKNIYNLITSNFTTVAEINIQGSASQEGDVKTNTDLCIARAEEVKIYLEKFFDATITASKTANIQPKTPDTDEKTRKTFRNVTLKISGTKITPGQSTDKIVRTPITGKIACDTVTIQELQMTFVVEIDPDKAKKAGLFKKGVDTVDKEVRTRK